VKQHCVAVIHSPTRGLQLGLFTARARSVAAQQLLGQIPSTPTVGVGSSVRGAGQTANTRTSADFQMYCKFMKKKTMCYPVIHT